MCDDEEREVGCARYLYPTTLSPLTQENGGFESGCCKKRCKQKTDGCIPVMVRLVGRVKKCMIGQMWFKWTRSGGSAGMRRLEEKTVTFANL